MSDPRSRHEDASAATILRGVVMDKSVHTLGRPRRAAAAAPSGGPTPVPVADGQPDRYEQGYARALSDAAERLRNESAQAQAAVEQLAAQAVRKGFEQGREEGLAAGRQEAAAEAERTCDTLRREAEAMLKDQLHRLESIASALASQSREIVAACEDDLVALAHEVVCRVLGERAADPEAIANMARELLSRSGWSSDVRFHVHPVDAEMLAAGHGTSGSPLHWVADPAVELGGAILKGTQGTLDARLEVQLLELRRTLDGVRAQWRRDGEEST